MLTNSPSEYFLRWRGRQSGPFTLKAIEEKLEAHEIGVWHEVLDQGQWIFLDDFLHAQMPLEHSSWAASSPQQPASAVALALPLEREHALRVAAEDRSSPDPASAVATRLPSPATAPSAKTEPLPEPPPTFKGKPKRRLTFAALGLLMGFAGLHNFYAGYMIRGLIQLTLTVLSVRFNVGWILIWLWAISEVIMVTKDKRGRPMI